MSCALVFAAALCAPGTAFSQSSSSVKPESVKPRREAQIQQAGKPVIAKLQLETSEPLFATLAALNSCGFDLDLTEADPVRAQIRTEVAASISASQPAADAHEQLCRFYHEKQQPDAARDLAQYITLALYLKEPPEFGTDLRESDLPPDAYAILGFVPLLRNFYAATDLHRIWAKHQAEYERLLARVHDPVANMVQRTDLYLKLPTGNFVGRRYVIFVEPMGAAGEVNARNSGSDYYLVITPSASGVTHIDQIRHTYLHFILDTLVSKRATSIKRLEPLAMAVRTAPMDESFKNDTSLLVVESLIQAIEARTLTLPAGPKDAAALDKLRNERVEASMQQGYILTHYFFDALEKFERDPVGLREEFYEMLAAIDVDREKRRASRITFAAQATPELLRGKSQHEPQLLDVAEQRLAGNDPEGAHRFAQQALDQHQGDPGRAMFVLARAAVLQKDMDGAQLMFERTLQVTHEPRTVAWSHIYIARILDLKCDREAALTHYRSALSVADPSSEIKAAADKGINELPPASRCEKSDDKQ